VLCALLTISDTRTPQTDEAGRLLKKTLADAGHDVASHEIVPDDAEQITAKIEPLLGSMQAVITTGGTGLSRRDVTVEAIEPLLDKRLDGFGEYLRMLSFEEVGSAGMMSRAFAGVARGTIIICLPGSRNAVNLALEKLILPELGHMIWEATR